MAGNPIKLSQYPQTEYEPAPTLGQHTRQILTEYLHMPQAEIDDLLADHQLLQKQPAGFSHE